MRRSAYVLVGGQSSRMGRDKALLPFQGRPLAAHIAAQAEAAAGCVHLVGSPSRYSHLGWPVLSDLRPGQGPLAAIETALAHGAGEWNLIVACDMPAVSSSLLAQLLQAAENSRSQCLLPVMPSGRLHPLCAVYHTSALPAIRAALDAGVRKVLEALSGIAVTHWLAPRESDFRNINTIEQWEAHLRGNSVG